MSGPVEIGDSFRVGEVWEPPRGSLFCVDSREGWHVTLKSLANGRRQKRGWGDVIGWVRPPAYNAAPSTEGGEDGS